MPTMKNRKPLTAKAMKKGGKVHKEHEKREEHEAHKKMKKDCK